MDRDRILRIADSAVRLGIVEPGDFGVSLRKEGPILGEAAIKYAEGIAYLIEFADLDVCPSSDWLRRKMGVNPTPRKLEEEMLDIADSAGMYARELMRTDNASKGRLAKRKRDLIQSIKWAIEAAPHLFRI